MNRMAVFASGNGSNAENIIRYFKTNTHVNITHVLTNNPEAKVIEKAAKYDVPTIVFNRNEFYKEDKVLNILLEEQIDFIVLAGFMWLVPQKIIQQFFQKVVNIHPALLPKYGGKGMYGDFVHKAVSEAQETETGITIHYVNEKYDEGDIIFQKSVKIVGGEDPASIAQKIHALEYENFPKVIEKLFAN